MAEDPIVMKNLQKLLDYDHGLISLLERRDILSNDRFRDRFQWLKLEDSRGKSMELGLGRIHYNFSKEAGEIFCLESFDPDCSEIYRQHQKFGNLQNAGIGLKLMISPEPIKSRMEIGLGFGVVSKDQIGSLEYGNHVISYECRNNLKRTEFLFNLFQKYASDRPE